MLCQSFKAVRLVIKLFHECRCVLVYIRITSCIVYQEVLALFNNIWDEFNVDVTFICGVIFCLPLI